MQVLEYSSWSHRVTIVHYRALSLYSSLDKLKNEIVDLKHSVAESLITPAKKSIEELQSELSQKISLDNLKLADKISLENLNLVDKINLDKLKLDSLPLPSPPCVSAEEQTSSR